MVGFASKKQVLIVGNDALQLYVSGGKTISLYGEFSAHSGTLVEELTASFKAAGAPLVILFDVMEQQYRKEILPNVSFMDKGKVIQRKLQMAFPQQKMRAHIQMQQHANDGKGVTALFAAVSDSPIIEAVIRAILDSAVSVIGSALLPLEATGLTTKLVQEAHKRAQTPDDTRWSVLMTYHKTGGLRQVVIRDGELALTRMTPIPSHEGNIEQLTDEMVREFNATLTYLSRFGYVPSDGLDLVVVSSPDICQRLRQYGLAVTHLYPMTMAEAGQLINVNTNTHQEQDPFADMLHAGWVGSQRKLFVTLDAPLISKIQKARQIAKLATIGFAFAALYIAYQCFTIQAGNFENMDGLDQARSRNQVLKREVDEASVSLNTLKYDPEKINVMLAVYDQYRKQNLDIEPTLNVLMAQVDRDQYRIGELSITEITSETEVQALQQSAIEALTLIRQQEAIMAQPKLPDGSVDPSVPLPEIVPPEAKQVVTIRSEIKFNDDMEIEDAARATYEFIDRLIAAFPGRQVELTDIVGNLSESRTIEGSLTEAEVGSDADAAARNNRAEMVSKFTIKGML